MKNCIVTPANNEKVFKPKALGIRPSVNPQFVARKNSQGKIVLELLNEQLSASKTSLAIQVITGMGGLGKTQLAVEYIRQTESDYDGIFWVQAGTIPVNYTFFTDALNIDLKEVCPDELVQTIHKSLMHRDYQKVLWVYDDVPNAKIFKKTLFNNTIKSIWDQAETKVDIVITSRYRNNWKRWAIIELELFATEDTQAYIDSFFKESLFPFPKPSREYIEQLNTLLGGLPLAIVQAVDYLRNKQDGTGIAEYIAAYQANHHQEEWLTHSIEDLDDYDKTIWTTWNISRSCLSKEADLLLKMSCFLAHEHIAKLLFTPLWEDKVHSIAKELADYSLIKLNHDLQSFTIHVLLQKVLQLQQGNNSFALRQVALLSEQACGLFDEKEPHTWAMVKQWLPHINPLLGRIEDIGIKELTFFSYGNKAYFFGNYLMAKDYYSQALALQQKHYGEEHIKLAAALHNLGVIEFHLGHYEAAKNYYSQALALKKNHYGEEHIELAITLHNLGNIKLILGHYGAAKAYYSQVLALQQQHYGEGHIELAATLGNLGNVEFDLGYYEAAKAYYSQTLAMETNYYGEGHIKLSTALYNLGRVEHCLGQYERAKDYYSQALALKKNHYGEGHVQLANTFICLGVVEKDLGQYEAAKDYYSQALALQQKHYGAEHIKLAATLISLGKTYQKLGNNKAAKSYATQALTLQDKHYGDRHVQLSNTYNLLGSIYLKKQKAEEAHSYYCTALQISEAHYKAEHIELTESLLGLGDICLVRNDTIQALIYYKRALTIQETQYGVNHIKVLDTLKGLANVHQKLNQLDKVEQYQERIKAIEKE